jgi:AraC-like DNA-binding protein
LLFSMGACILEIFLMYTGYIVHCLYLVDFSEPLAFVIGPSFYLIVLSMTENSFPKRNYLHFAFPLLYLILVMPFFLLPENVKYNSWIDSYKLDLPYREFLGRDPRTFWITDHHTDLAFASFILYALLSLVQVVKAFRSKKQSFFKPAHAVLRNLRNGTIEISITIVLALLVKYFNPNDTGDHMIAASIALLVYITSFNVIRQSGFFLQAPLRDVRYKASGMSGDQQSKVLQRLERVMADNKPFLDPDFSLPDLANRCGTTVHILSQAINSGLGKSFFEMTAAYRVEEAKRLLKEQKNVKVEEIAGQVGYNSKSSFNIAFKKITGQTPSDYRSDNKVL